MGVEVSAVKGVHKNSRRSCVKTGEGKRGEGGRPGSGNAAVFDPCDEVR